MMGGARLATDFRVLRAVDGSDAGVASRGGDPEAAMDLRVVRLG
jgi:hypothetical protein